MTFQGEQPPREVWRQKKCPLSEATKEAIAELEDTYSWEEFVKLCKKQQCRRDIHGF